MSKESKALDIGEIIDRAPWFQNIPADARQTLISAAKVRTFSNNSYIYNIGEQTADVYCVLEGRVRIGISSSLGQEFALTDLAAGTWLGESAMQVGNTRVLSAQAKAASTLLVIPRTTLVPLADAHPIIYRNLFYDHLSRTRATYELLGGMLFYPLRARLAGRMLLLISEHGEAADGGYYLNINLSQNDFARLTLGSRQRINKILREWHEQGIVINQNDRYFIPNIDAFLKEVELKEG